MSTARSQPPSQPHGINNTPPSQQQIGNGHPSSSASSSSSSFFRHRNGSGVFTQSPSGLFERFRRPRTATNGSSATNLREAGNLGSGGIGNSGQRSTIYSSRNGSTSGEIADSPSRGSRLSQFTSRTGLPRSSSSSQVYLPSHDETSPSQSNRTGLTSHGASQSQGNIRIGSGGGGSGITNTNVNNNNNAQRNCSSNNNNNSSASGLSFPIISRTGSSQGNPSGPPMSGGFSRMFRRYSQGAGRNMAAANEAHAIAAGVTASPNSSNLPNSNSASSNLNHNNDAENDPNNNNLTNNQSDSMAIDGVDSSLQHQQSLAAPAVGLSTTGTMLGIADTASGNSSINHATSSSNELSNESPQTNPAHRIRLVPHLEAIRSLHFEPIERDLIEGAMAVKIGRFTDRGQGSQSAGPNESQGMGGGTGSSVGNNNSSNVAGSGMYTAASSVAGTAVNSTINERGARGGAIPSATGGAGRVDTGRIAFKSKVVSRGHAEIWSEGGGKVFIRDTKSSSGTFLNHIRLSAPNVESKPFQIKDGDVVQLGVDYQGGTEEIYRCVKMRVELNRGWQRGANQFNVNALRQLRALQGSPLPDPTVVANSKARTDGAVASTTPKTTPNTSAPTNRQSLNVTDCCICLFSVTVCQALFIAPCSHVFHYKCIRPLLNLHHPGFSCPLCRTFADLEEDVEEDEAWQRALLKEAGALDQEESSGGGGEPRAIDASTPMNEEPLPSLLAVAIASENSSIHENFVDAAPSIHDHTAIIGDGMGGVNVNGSGRRRSSATESLSASRDSRHTPNGSRRSESSHHDSPARSTDVHMIKRPDTAVSSSTAVPFGGGGGAIGDTNAASSHTSPRQSSRSRASNFMSGLIGNRFGNTSDQDETQEMLFEDSPAAMYDQSSSGPMDISSNNNNNNQSSTFARHLMDGLTGSPGLNESRTPQNELFLSTLAEAPTRGILRPTS